MKIILKDMKRRTEIVEHSNDNDTWQTLWIYINNTPVRIPLTIEQTEEILIAKSQQKQIQHEN